MNLISYSHAPFLSECCNMQCSVLDIPAALVGREKLKTEQWLTQVRRSGGM